MKNKINLKKYIIITSIVFIIFAVILTILNIVQYIEYNKNTNIAINRIIVNIKEKYPDVDVNEIIEILNNNANERDMLRQYGIDIEKESSILINNHEHKLFLSLNIGILIILLLSLLFVFIMYDKSQNKKVQEITEYIKEINRGIYNLNIQENDEDELSILKNELYKITVMLKEQSENSKRDKMTLKKSLEDISHQLKTPLTSIMIMLDNLLDNQEMNKEIRNDFIKSIYRETANINFFIQTLLKLSKFDANTIKFNKNDTELQYIINTAVQNVMPICDLKNIEIIIENKANVEPHVNCDAKWQVEAITNIIKNCVEYSKEKSKIYINYEENNVYCEITIQDNGCGMDKKDLKHIFERFYKAKNSNKDSIGIGLALAKTIIENDNGYITVESEIGKGTRFNVRYLK